MYVFIQPTAPSITASNSVTDVTQHRHCSACSVCPDHVWEYLFTAQQVSSVQLLHAADTANAYIFEFERGVSDVGEGDRRPVWQVGQREVWSEATEAGCFGLLPRPPARAVAQHAGGAGQSCAPIIQSLL